MNWQRYLIFGLIPLWAGLAVAADALSGPVGQALPDFSLITLVGEEVTAQQLQGKLLLLCFASTEFPVCRDALRELAIVSRRTRGKEVVIVWVALVSGNIQELSRTVLTEKIDFLVLTGDERYLHHYTRRLGNMRILPTIFLIDRNGVIRERWQGFRRADLLFTTLKQYL